MESSTSGSKKRKISHHDDDDEEENMEKFYALIKSIHETRDRLIVNKDRSEEIVNKAAATAAAADGQSEIKKRKVEEGKQVVAWEPSFQREDFMGESDQLKKPPVSFATTSQSKQGTDNDQKEEVKDGLDLTLSL